MQKYSISKRFYDINAGAAKVDFNSHVHRFHIPKERETDFLFRAFFNVVWGLWGTVKTVFVFSCTSKDRFGYDNSYVYQFCKHTVNKSILTMKRA